MTVLHLPRSHGVRHSLYRYLRADVAVLTRRQVVGNIEQFFRDILMLIGSSSEAAHRFLPFAFVW